MHRAGTPPASYWELVSLEFTVEAAILINAVVVNVSAVNVSAAENKSDSFTEFIMQHSFHIFANL
jgi:hypothetical protein